MPYDSPPLEVTEVRPHAKGSGPAPDPDASQAHPGPVAAEEAPTHQVHRANGWLRRLSLPVLALACAGLGFFFLNRFPSERQVNKPTISVDGSLLLAAADNPGGGTTSKTNGDAEEPAADTVNGIANPFPNRPPAPSLSGGTEWLNVSEEISLKDLRGKIVILDFWTYCCINCLHVLPDLKFLEKKYNKELVVIGVHSAKFDNEKETGNIRKAILRYEIEHPVVNDANMIIWRKFGVRAWPTMVMIDPEGRYCGYISGEGNREILDQIIGRVAKFHRAKKTLDERPIRFHLEKSKTKSGPLKFPGKVLADEKSDRVYIADTGHNRIVVTTLAGQLVEIFGTGEIGLKNGAAANATFDHPHGMALVGDLLFVADTENHLIRVVNLKTKTVRTLAGTGEQARRPVFRDNRTDAPLTGTPLNSPWDLTHDKGMLYIAMAGPHQIWRHKLGTTRISLHSGSGREDVLNGVHNDAAFAQPSGISNDGESLYVADSEGSSIRKVDMSPSGRARTIVGTSDLPNGRSLFEFGDVDAVGGAARLQHPLGVLFDRDTIYVADTYNHKIKRVGSPGTELEFAL